MTEDQRDPAKKRADLVAGGKALVDLSAWALSLGTGLPFGAATGVLHRYYGTRRQEIVQQRLREGAAALKARLDGLEERGLLDLEFIESDEFAELADEVLEYIVRERSEDKRRRFAAVLSTAAAEPTDRSWAGTAIRILDSLEEVHVELLAALQEMGRRLNRRDEVVHTRVLAGALYGDEIRARAKEHEDLMEWFKGREGATEEQQKWAASEVAKARKAAQETDREAHAQTLSHVWYLGGMGLLRQVSENSVAPNQLAARFLDWVTDPWQHPVNNEPEKASETAETEESPKEGEG